MSSEKTLALVLRTIEFSETSYVVTLFTRDFGKVRALAKGARRPKGPFEAALDLLGLCRIVLLRKSSDALDLLTEAKLERRFRPAGGELSNLYAAYYIAELLNELTDEGDPHPELFDAADSALAALRFEGNADAVVLRFELTALRVLGHLPSLRTCADCGKPVPPAPRVPFSQIAGGVLCAGCRSGKRQVVSVTAAVLETMQAFANGQHDGQLQEPIERKTYGELRAVMNHYFAGLLGRQPRMHRYLTNT